MHFKKSHLMRCDASEFFCVSLIRTVSATYTIFNRTHAISDLNNIYKVHSILRIFTENRGCTGRQTDRPTDR